MYFLYLLMHDLVAVIEQRKFIQRLRMKMNSRLMRNVKVRTLLVNLLVLLWMTLILSMVITFRQTLVLYEYFVFGFLSLCICDYRRGKTAES